MCVTIVTYMEFFFLYNINIIVTDTVINLYFMKADL